MWQTAATDPKTSQNDVQRPQNASAGSGRADLRTKRLKWVRASVRNWCGVGVLGVVSHPYAEPHMKHNYAYVNTSSVLECEPYDYHRARINLHLKRHFAFFGFRQSARPSVGFKHCDMFLNC